MLCSWYTVEEQGKKQRDELKDKAIQARGDDGSDQSSTSEKRCIFKVESIGFLGGLDGV